MPAAGDCPGTGTAAAARCVEGWRRARARRDLRLHHRREARECDERLHTVDRLVASGRVRHLSRILVTGVEDPATQAHSIDESLDLGVLERAATSEALMLQALGASDR